MEERGEGSKLPESGVPQEQRRLYSGASKIDRLTQHTLELKDDLMAWVDLKIKSVKLELQEKLDEQKKTIAIFGVVAVLGIYGLTFLLVTIALFIGWALGHPAWGFLIVTVVLLGLGIPDRHRRLAGIGRTALFDEEPAGAERRQEDERGNEEPFTPCERR